MTAQLAMLAAPAVVGDGRERSTVALVTTETPQVAASAPAPDAPSSQTRTHTLQDAQRDYDRALDRALRATGERAAEAWAECDRAMARLQQAARGRA